MFTGNRAASQSGILAPARGGEEAPTLSTSSVPGMLELAGHQPITRDLPTEFLQLLGVVKSGTTVRVGSKWCEHGRRELEQRREAWQKNW